MPVVSLDRLPIIRWLPIAAAVLALDWLTKSWAVAVLTPYQPVPVAPFLNLTLVFNPGAAFSLLSDAGGWQRWFFIVVSILVVIVLSVWLHRIPRGQVWVPVAMALVLGGALGNLWDRLTLGLVVDFIDVYYRHWHWPAFNVADAAISTGAVMLLLSALRPEPPH
ncbi:MAG: signal peptidase II [Gammaproteobacteria bacterium]